MDSLGLPPSAGTSVGAFLSLRANVEQARRDGDVGKFIN